MTDTTEPIAAHSVAVLDYGMAGPYAVAFGPGGDMWVTLVNTGELVRRSPDGRERRFTIGERPGQLTVTSEATWCAVTGADRIAIITSGDRLNFIDVPGGPYGIAADGPGALVTLMQGNKLAVVSRDGIRSELAVPLDGAYPAMATAHRDGSVWVSLNQRGALARRDAAGDTELITLPDGAAPVGIAAAGGVCLVRRHRSRKHPSDRRRSARQRLRPRARQPAARGDRRRHRVLVHRMGNEQAGQNHGGGRPRRVRSLRHRRGTARPGSRW
ncbi:hypothetical protein OAX51_01230 (plasmid) [Rhodococcus erythropolis]